EWRPPSAWDITFRTGYAFEATPVPDQIGLTSFADNSRHVFSLGGGIRFRALEPILTRPLSLDIAVQWHHLSERLTAKDQTLFPGGAFSSGGNILRGELTLSVDL